MIRTYRPEDLEKVIALHAELYRRERGYDDSFARFVEEGIRDFGNRNAKEREQLWVVDQAGRHGGSIGITQLDQETAQLRWFLLDPSVRGNGFGRGMLEQAIAFCRECGYASILLWTNSELEAARALYANFGFRLAESRSAFLSGRMLQEEMWKKQLASH